MQAEYLMKYQEMTADQMEPYVANIKDLSATGLRFLSERFFAEGTVLNVSVFVPPLGRAIRTPAKVLRIRASAGPLYYVSLRFMHLPERDYEDLNLFIEGLSKKRRARSIVDHEGSELKRKPLFAGTDR